MTLPGLRNWLSRFLTLPADLTVEGRLLLCLGNEHSADLRAVMRARPGDREALAAEIVRELGVCVPPKSVGYVLWKYALRSMSSWSLVLIAAVNAIAYSSLIVTASAGIVRLWYCEIESGPPGSGMR